MLEAPRRVSGERSNASRLRRATSSSESAGRVGGVGHCWGTARLPPHRAVAQERCISVVQRRGVIKLPKQVVVGSGEGSGTPSREQDGVCKRWRRMRQGKPGEAFQRTRRLRAFHMAYAPSTRQLGCSSAPGCSGAWAGHPPLQSRASVAFLLRHTKPLSPRPYSCFGGCPRATLSCDTTPAKHRNSKVSEPFLRPHPAVFPSTSRSAPSSRPARAQRCPRRTAS